MGETSEATAVQHVVDTLACYTLNLKDTHLSAHASIVHTYCTLSATQKHLCIHIKRKL